MTMIELTADVLRQDADRREALARAASPGPWSVEASADVNAGTDSCNPALLDMAHICANDPLAVQASCERDRLLADWDAWWSRGSQGDLAEWMAQGWALHRRFAALVVSNAG